MRAARRLAAEMELWRLVWQQVETFADRIDGARDQDAPHAARFEALMVAAGVVERERATRVENEPLGDPVIDQPPAPDATTGWGADHRIWRLPGTDELELAVANLYEEPGSGDDPVMLLPPSDFYSYVVEPDDRRFADSDAGVVTVQAPRYPGQGSATIVGAALDAALGTIGIRCLKPEIKEDGDIVSLFSPDNRGKAAEDIDQTGEWILPWSTLAANRRSNRDGADSADVKYFSAGSATVPWTPSLAITALALAGNVKSNTPLSDGRAAMTVAREIAEAAEAAAAVSGSDGTLLRDAAEALEEAGVTDPDLPAILEQAAGTFGARPELFIAVAAAARVLEGQLAMPLGAPALPADLQTARSAAADQLSAVTTALSAALVSGGALFDASAESGPLAQEADDSAAARIAYPDGSLRVLRALEGAFVRYWPSRMRWFRDRHRLSLAILMQRFRSPFLAGLRALISGGDTGLPADGLTLLVPAATRATRLALDQPASLTSALGDIEAGHLALFPEGRQSAALVLGLTSQDGRLALDTAPLRVSVQPGSSGDPADAPGLIAAGRRLETFMPGAGLTTEALRLGEHPTDPAADGIVEMASILYGQLALLFGWETVERGLAVGTPTYANRRLPDPSDRPAEDLALYGESPANATTIVIRGADEDYWDRSDPADPQPRFARSGEYLLIRGRGKGEDDAPGPIRQSAIQVESVYRTTVKSFHRMDATTAALLSTTPLPSADIDECLADCAPEEDLIVITLARSWQRKALVSDITLRRDFDGFDPPSLATGRLLPASVIRTVTGEDPTGPGDVDRSSEFDAASTILADWTRFANR